MRPRFVFTPPAPVAPNPDAWFPDEGPFSPSIEHKRIESEIKQGGRVRNLFYLSQEEKDALKGQTSKFHGLARVFIHPYFEINHNPKSQLGNQVSVGLERILGRPNDATPPIVVFEEERMLVSTVNRLRASTESSGHPVYLVVTNNVTPYPKIIPEMSDTSSEGSWSYINQIMKELGVNRIMLGGEIFEIVSGLATDRLQKFYNSRQRLGAKNVNYNLFGCMGEAVKAFSEGGFEIEISDFARPDSRKTLVK